jgi:hypothetical protein
LKNIQFIQKRSLSDVGKDGIVGKWINSIERKPSTLPKDNENCLQGIFEFGHLSQAQGYERVNSFERLFLENRGPLGSLRSYPTGFFSLCSAVQEHRSFSSRWQTLMLFT